MIRLDCSPQQVIGPVENLPGPASACPHGIGWVIPYFALIAIMGATQLYTMKQMQATRDVGDDPQAKTQQAMMKFMPLLFVFFGFGFPAGLTLYYATFNVLLIAQQALMLRLVPPLPPVTKAGSKADAKADAKADGKPVKKGSDKPSAGKPPKKATLKPGGSDGDGRKTPAAGGKASGKAGRKKKKR